METKNKLRTSVIMLPTEKAMQLNGLILCDAVHTDAPKHLVWKGKIAKCIFSDADNAISHWIPQHLYFISDREMINNNGRLEVQLDDIYYDSNNKVIGKISHIGKPFSFKGTVQFPYNEDLHINRHCSFHCYKVLATTDSSLNLPLIPQSFVDKYIEKQGDIKEVMIETIGFEDIGGDQFWCRTRKDNTVICSPIKDSWTREEVIAIHKANCERLTNSYTSEDIKWIEQNL